MTKVGRLYEEEKIEYAQEYAFEKTKEIAQKLILIGVDTIDIMKATGLKKSDIIKITEEIK